MIVIYIPFTAIFFAFFFCYKYVHEWIYCSMKHVYLTFTRKYVVYLSLDVLSENSLPIFHIHSWKWNESYEMKETITWKAETSRCFKANCKTTRTPSNIVPIHKIISVRSGLNSEVGEVWITQRHRRTVLLLQLFLTNETKISSYEIVLKKRVVILLHRNML